MLRIRAAAPLEGRSLRLTLTDGTVVERDLSDMLWGQFFARLATDRGYFQRVRVRHGTVVWPDDVDIAPEILIWGGPDPDPREGRVPPAFLRVRSPQR